MLDIQLPHIQDIFENSSDQIHVWRRCYRNSKEVTIVVLCDKASHILGVETINSNHYRGCLRQCVCVWGICKSEDTGLEAEHSEQSRNTDIMVVLETSALGNPLLGGPYAQGAPALKILPKRYLGVHQWLGPVCTKELKEQIVSWKRPEVCVAKSHCLTMTSALPMIDDRMLLILIDLVTWRVSAPRGWWVDAWAAHETNWTDTGLSNSSINHNFFDTLSTTKFLLKNWKTLLRNGSSFASFGSWRAIQTISAQVPRERLSIPLFLVLCNVGAGNHIRFELS